MRAADTGLKSPRSVSPASLFNPQSLRGDTIAFSTLPALPEIRRLERVALSYPAKPPHLRIMKPWCFRLNLLPKLLACTQDFLLVHCHQPVVVNNRLSVANYSAGAPSGGVENEVADEVERVVGIHS